MINVYAGDVRHLARVRSHVPPGVAYAPSGDWHQFVQTMSTASCSVIVTSWMEAETLERVRHMRSHHPLHPLVIVMIKDADNMRQVAALGVAEFVWLHELELALLPAVQRAFASGFFEELAQTVERDASVTPVLRNALAVACRRAVPLHSVAELAALVGCHRQTLWYHWHKHVRSDATMHLSDVLVWLQLCRGIINKTPLTGWKEVARTLGIHQHTLARNAQSLAGLTLREMGSADARAVLVGFRDLLVAHLDASV